MIYDLYQKSSNYLIAVKKFFFLFINFFRDNTTTISMMLYPSTAEDVASQYVRLLLELTVDHIVSRCWFNPDNTKRWKSKKRRLGFG